MSALAQRIAAIPKPPTTLPPPPRDPFNSQLLTSPTGQPFTPQAITATGRRISAGELAADLQNRITSEDVRIRNHLDAELMKHGLEKQQALQELSEEVIKNSRGNIDGPTHKVIQDYVKERTADIDARYQSKVQSSRSLAETARINNRVGNTQMVPAATPDRHGFTPVPPASRSPISSVPSAVGTPPRYAGTATQTMTATATRPQAQIGNPPPPAPPIRNSTASAAAGAVASVAAQAKGLGAQISGAFGGPAGAMITFGPIVKGAIDNKVDEISPQLGQMRRAIDANSRNPFANPAEKWQYSIFNPFGELWKWAPWNQKDTKNSLQPNAQRPDNRFPSGPSGQVTEVPIDMPQDTPPFPFSVNIVGQSTSYGRTLVDSFNGIAPYKLFSSRIDIGKNFIGVPIKVVITEIGDGNCNVQMRYKNSEGQIVQENVSGIGGMSAYSTTTSSTVLDWKEVFVKGAPNTPQVPWPRTTSLDDGSWNPIIIDGQTHYQPSESPLPQSAQTPSQPSPMPSSPPSAAPRPISSVPPSNLTPANPLASLNPANLLPALLPAVIQAGTKPSPLPIPAMPAPLPSAKPRLVNGYEPYPSPTPASANAKTPWKEPEVVKQQIIPPTNQQAGDPSLRDLKQQMQDQTGQIRNDIATKGGNTGCGYKEDDLAPCSIPVHVGDAATTQKQIQVHEKMVEFVQEHFAQMAKLSQVLAVPTLTSAAGYIHVPNAQLTATAVLNQNGTLPTIAKTLPDLMQQLAAVAYARQGLHRLGGQFDKSVMVPQLGKVQINDALTFQQWQFSQIDERLGLPIPHTITNTDGQIQTKQFANIQDALEEVNATSAVALQDLEVIERYQFSNAQDIQKLMQIALQIRADVDVLIDDSGAKTREEKRSHPTHLNLRSPDQDGSLNSLFSNGNVHYVARVWDDTADKNQKMERISYDTQIAAMSNKFDFPKQGNPELPLDKSRARAIADNEDIWRVYVNTVEEPPEGYISKGNPIPDIKEIKNGNPVNVPKPTNPNQKLGQ